MHIDTELLLYAVVPVVGLIAGYINTLAGSGSLLTLPVLILLGLPAIRWFVLASVVVGAVLAGGLFLWRSSRSSSFVPTNSILQR